MMDFASLCVLSFNRKTYLERSLKSLWQNTHFPYELIVLDDASDPETQEYIFWLAKTDSVSAALFTTHHNRGIGVAVNRGFSISRGDWLFKLDADLEYKEGWLTHAVNLLNRPEIGCLGLFKYWHEPCLFPNELIETKGAYHHVIDFVGSAIGCRREVYEQFGPWREGGGHFSEDVTFKKAVAAGGLEMALPLDDIAVNFGFGEQHSSLIREIDWKEHKHKYWIPQIEPLLFGV